MSDEPDAYQTYVLRLWRARCQGKWQWRGSLECPRTAERRWFADLEQLFAFVSERCHSQTPDAPGTGPEGQYPRGALGT
jgi:hypothetical protein